MSEKHKLFQISVKAVLYKDDKILVLRDKKAHSEEHKKLEGWNLPGGRLRENEKIREALKREIKEELGDIKYEIKGIIESTEFVNSDGPVIVLYYAAEYLGGNIKLSHEHKEFKWLTFNEILKEENIAECMKGVTTGLIKKNELENSLDNWKRTQADFENYKKDQVKAMEEFRKFARLNLVMQILPVLDNFNASLEHVPEDQKDNGWVIGINYIKKQLEDILKNNGLEEIEVRIGDKFNPEFHEAIKNEDNEDNKNSKSLNIIKKIIQK